MREEASREKHRATTWGQCYNRVILREGPWRRGRFGKGRERSSSDIFLRFEQATPFSQPPASPPAIYSNAVSSPTEKISIPILLCFSKSQDDLVDKFQPARTGLRSLKPPFPGVAWRKLPTPPLGENLSGVGHY